MNTRMTPRRAAGFATFGVILAACALPSAHAGTSVKAPPKHGVGGGVISLAPPWVCTMQNRLEIFVDEDSIMWACECEALKSGHICRWQVIGGVEAVSSRKRLKQARRLHISVRYAHPAVVA